MGRPLPPRYCRLHQAGEGGPLGAGGFAGGEAEEVEVDALGGLGDVLLVEHGGLLPETWGSPGAFPANLT